MNGQSSIQSLIERHEFENILRDSFFFHIFWVALLIKQYESLNPRNTGLFSTSRVMLFSDYKTELIEKSHGPNSLSVFVVFNIPLVFD